MALIYNKSRPSVCSEVDLFSLPCTDTTIDSSLYAAYKPMISFLDSNAKLDFKVLGSSSQYLDTNDSFLEIQLKVVNPDGTDLAADAEVSPVNLLLHSLFSNVEVSFNNKLF